ncbi:uncharacterized protein V1516DRAFT_55748 [Lipomyces oligophaga]|uniref:uncharacterized protein n=1 Tax=Lipomyces oligophaga TaxID=45792 RepID=UPI0034CFD4B5
MRPSIRLVIGMRTRGVRAASNGRTLSSRISRSRSNACGSSESDDGQRNEKPKLPTHFSDPGEAGLPEPIIVGERRRANGQVGGSGEANTGLNVGTNTGTNAAANPGLPPTNFASDLVPDEGTQRNVMRDAILCIMVVILTYVAFEGARERKEHERKLKSVLTWGRENQERVQGELERKMTAVEKVVTEHVSEENRNYMMLRMHIAMLRQQLVESGIEPASADEVVKKFRELAQAKYKPMNKDGRRVRTYEARPSDLDPYWPELDQYGGKHARK